MADCKVGDRIYRADAQLGVFHATVIGSVGPRRVTVTLANRASYYGRTLDRASLSTHFVFSKAEALKAEQAQRAEDITQCQRALEHAQEMYARALRMTVDDPVYGDRADDDKGVEFS